MLLSFCTLGLFVTITSLTTAAKFASQKHHKVRHKHNSFSLRDNHVNEIREAFDEYRNTLRNTKMLEEYPEIKDVEFSDDYSNAIDNNLMPNSWEAPVVATHRNNAENSRGPHFKHIKKHVVVNPTLSSEFFLRNKRVYTTATQKVSSSTTTTTVKSIDNYDEEYEDEDNDTANRRLKDDAHAGSMRFNRDNTDTQPLADGESLTDYKMKTLGTLEDVRKSFQNELQNNGQDVHHHIRQNMMRTKVDGMCRWPNKRVIEMPQHAQKMYTPKKYVVYQCSDDTACCGSSDKTCVAKKTEELVFWFHVRFVDSTGVEPMKVQNHTECECIYKNRPIATKTMNRPNLWPMLTISTSTKAPACRCPTHFDADVEDETCGCVCKDAKIECRQRYEGKEGFTMSDQRCILDDNCVQPHCLHGTYSSINGRCPDKYDKINKGSHGSRLLKES